MQLCPAAYTLRYLGFEVLEPVMAHGVHGYHRGARRRALESRLTALLADQSRVIRAFDRHPVMRFNADDDFETDGRLTADAESHTLFIRHTP